MHSFTNIGHQSMKVLETRLVVRLVMRPKKMSLEKLVDLLFGISTLLSVVVTENSRVTNDAVTDFFDVLRLAPTVDIIILNTSIKVFPIPVDAILGTRLHK
jgi:hypothetical protein